MIPVRYNHESRELTLEEAQALAQKGLKFDELSPTLDKIRYLAAANQKSVQEMVDAPGRWPGQAALSIHPGRVRRERGACKTAV